MKPFDLYPGEGETFLPKRSGSNSRRGYGLQLQRLTNQHRCAYCNVDLVSDYYRWLLLNVDHVIPESECIRLGIPEEWAQSLSNQVISCSGCNLFDNRYQMLDVESKSEWVPLEFFELRNRIFKDRAEKIRHRREEEQAFFSDAPWTTNEGLIDSGK